MKKHISERRRFSLVARARSFIHAFRGLRIILKTQHNAWLHGVIAGIVVFLGFFLHISYLDWGMVILAISSVFAAEAFNTAVEIDIDLTSPTYHPYARDTKDVASAAVLITVFGAIIVGFIVFIPKILAFLR